MATAVTRVREWRDGVRAKANKESVWKRNRTPAAQSQESETESDSVALTIRSAQLWPQRLQTKFGTVEGMGESHSPQAVDGSTGECVNGRRRNQ